MKVYTDRPHASLLKAVAITGIGRSNVIDLGKPIHADDEELGAIGIDLDELVRHLKEAKDGLTPSGVTTASIVSLSFGEVNTVRDNLIFDQ